MGSVHLETLICESSIRCRSDDSDNCNPRLFVQRKPREKGMKFKLIQSVLIAIAVVIITIGTPLVACSPQSPVASTPAPTSTPTLIPTPTASSAATESGSSTAAGVKSAKWGSNVKLSYADSNFTFVSDGIPNHARPAEYVLPKPDTRGALNATTAYVGADPTTAQDYNFTIPLNPTKSAKSTPSNGGPIGVMISGAVLFNPYEGDGKSVATLDNFTMKNSKGQDIGFLDSCNGHPTPRMHDYHYHALPTCITQVVDKPEGPSHLIGVAFDGFPIYGDRAIDGSKITTTQLDTCNGITSATPEFPNGIYHYVLLDTKDSTSSIRCFSGTSSVTMKMPGMPGIGGGPGGSGMPPQP
jgi:YHYH protein